jgi:hypothetical protein
MTPAAGASSPPEERRLAAPASNHPTVEQLPEDAKATLASAVGGMLPELRTLVDQVNGIEGAGEVVKPAVEPIMAKLDAWAKQPA